MLRARLRDRRTSAAPQDREDQADDRQDQQDMNQRADLRARNESQYPQDEQDHRDGPEHVPPPFPPKVGASPTGRNGRAAPAVERPFEQPIAFLRVASS